MSENQLTAEAMNSHDATLLQDIDNALANCMKCGNCQAGCPIYRETRMEFSVARGKISLMQAVLSGKLPISKEFDSIMAMCLNCKTCSTNCPCGVKADDLILRGRNAAIKARGLHPIKKTVFALLRNRPLFNAALRMGGMFGWLTFKEVPDQKSAVLSRFPMPGMDPNRVMAPLASTPFRNQLPSVVKVPNAKRRVAFFTSCPVNFMYTDMGHAAVDVLKFNGNEVVIPAAQHCCGTPVRVSGAFDLANEMAKHNVEVFERENVDYIVGACGSCVEALKNYPKWLKDEPEWAARAQKLSQKVREISEFLVETGYDTAHLSPINKTVTMHDPCHMARGLKIMDQPRELLKAIPGLKFVEMKEHDRCCGSGGSFCLAHYDLSRKINDHKCQNIKATNADYVAASCPSCRMHITDGLIQNNMTQKVFHPIQLLAESYRNGSQ